MKKSRQAFIEQGIVKFGGGFLMVWECMGPNGVGIFVEMEGCMDAEQYVSILEDKLLPSMDLHVKHTTLLSEPEVRIP